MALQSVLIWAPWGVGLQTTRPAVLLNHRGVDGIGNYGHSTSKGNSYHLFPTLPLTLTLPLSRVGLGVAGVYWVPVHRRGRWVRSQRVVGKAITPSVSFIIIIVVLPAAPLCIDNFVPGIYGQSMSGYAPASLTYRPMARVVN